MTFKTDKHGAVDVVQGGELLTAEHLEDLSTAMEACLAAGSPMVVFDLREARLLDSAALESLLDFEEVFQLKGGALKLVVSNALCKDILRVSSLDEHFEVYDEVDRAVRSFLR